MNLNQMIKDELSVNNNKLSPSFIESVYLASTVTHHKLTANTRVCAITLPTGHEVVGIAQVLDAANDVESIGQSVAERNAKEELWKLCGTIAKCYLG